MIGICCAALSAHAQSPAGSPLGKTSADWPGVSFFLTQIVRLDKEHVLVAIQVRGDATVKNPTVIAGTDVTQSDKPGDIEPFTLTSAILVDQETGKKYPADGKLPAQPYWGDPDIISNIRPNTWFQLAVRFKAPLPSPPGPEGKQPEQKVSILLPRATAPIKDIVLPTSDVP